MSEAVREITREELIAEKAELEEQCRVLDNRCDMKERQIKEMQSHIDCLKAKLAEVQLNKQEFPTEPIKVADLLIHDTCVYENKLFKGYLGYTSVVNRYSKSDLRQIAEHLLVYCNNAEEE